MCHWQLARKQLNGRLEAQKTAGAWPSGAQAMHQRDVVDNVDPHLAQVFASGVFEKILIRRTEYFCFADYLGSASR